MLRRTILPAKNSLLNDNETGFPYAHRIPCPPSMAIKAFWCKYSIHTHVKEDTYTAQQQLTEALAANSRQILLFGKSENLYHENVRKFYSQAEL